MHILLGVLAVIAVILFWIYIGQEAKKGGSVGVETEVDEEKWLLKNCDWDQGRFEEKLQYEMDLRPKISRKQAIRNAYYRARNELK